MQMNSQELPQGQALKVSTGSASSNPLYSKMEGDNPSNTSPERIRILSSYEYSWISEDLDGNSCFLDDKEVQSLRSLLDKEGVFSCGDGMEDYETSQGFMVDFSHDRNIMRAINSFSLTGSAELYNHGDPKMKLLNQYDRALQDDDGTQFAEHVVDSGQFISDTLPIFTMSHSVADLKVCTGSFMKGTLTRELMGPRSRSLGDLCALNGCRSEFLYSDEALRSGVTFHRFMSHTPYLVGRSRSFEDLCALSGKRTRSFNKNKALFSGVTFPRSMALSCSHSMPDTYGKKPPCQANSGEGYLLANQSVGCHEVEDQLRDDVCQNERVPCDNHSSSQHNSDHYSGSLSDYRRHEMDSVDDMKSLQPSILNWDELSYQESKFKRIEEWINQIDTQDDTPPQELVGSYNSSPYKDSGVVGGMTTSELDIRSPRMEVAHNYISSLTATSSSAQMANLGLVVIPFLSAFISLRVLNLSGNAIVRIIPGALPRGLHMLNLSKNNISTVEGLRELTRLRVLDLSYNRIARIGHGLGSCSSLKELYLAGNKIGEVEGLQRLLKLNILDLRFNKISSAKCLGQLAANYGSLQAINLEGNPAQKNMRDDHLKGYLLNLLPHLVHVNKQTVRASSAKETSDRPTRSVTSHRYGRGMRSEHKHSQRKTHGSASHKLAASASSKNGRSSQALGSSLNLSRSRHGHGHGRLPPIGSKATHHLPNIHSKLFSLPISNPLRRSQSVGTI